MSSSCHGPQPIANRKILEVVTARRLTRYGGFNALSDFVRAQGVDRALANTVGREKAPWATSSLPETLRHLLDGYLLGLERIWRFEELRWVLKLAADARTWADLRHVRQHLAALSP